MDDIEIGLNDLMRQSGLTADDYLSKAHSILKDYDNRSIRDAIELAKIMAQDFHTSVMALKMQEMRDAIYKVASRGVIDHGDVELATGVLRRRSNNS